MWDISLLFGSPRSECVFSCFVNRKLLWRRRAKFLSHGKILLHLFTWSITFSMWPIQRSFWQAVRLLLNRSALTLTGKFDVCVKQTKAFYNFSHVLLKQCLRKAIWYFVEPSGLNDLPILSTPGSTGHGKTSLSSRTEPRFTPWTQKPLSLCQRSLLVTLKSTLSGPSTSHMWWDNVFVQLSSQFWLIKYGFFFLTHTIVLPPQPHHITHTHSQANQNFVFPTNNFCLLNVCALGGDERDELLLFPHTTCDFLLHEVNWHPDVHDTYRAWNSLGLQRPSSFKDPQHETWRGWIFWADVEGKLVRRGVFGILYIYS